MKAPGLTPSCVILAGGLARRMGGGDKPLRPIGGRTILDHVIARIAPQCSTLALNANGDPARLCGTLCESGVVLTANCEHRG